MWDMIDKDCPSYKLASDTQRPAFKQMLLLANRQNDSSFTIISKPAHHEIKGNKM